MGEEDERARVRVDIGMAKRILRPKEEGGNMGPGPAISFRLGVIYPQRTQREDHLTGMFRLCILRNTLLPLSDFVRFSSARVPLIRLFVAMRTRMFSAADGTGTMGLLRTRYRLPLLPLEGVDHGLLLSVPR